MQEIKLHAHNIGCMGLTTRAYLTMQIASLQSNTMNIYVGIAEILYNIINAVHRDGVSLLPVTGKR